jgi:hypothetical protein
MKVVFRRNGKTSYMVFCRMEKKLDWKGNGYSLRSLLGAH